MTKQHFIALADYIREHNRCAPNEPGMTMSFDKSHLDTLADFCQSVNPQFKRDRWLDYIAGRCGSNGGAVK
jgi:hypothetical protein